MKYVILSYMPQGENPRILFQDSGIIDDEVLDTIPQLMDSHAHAESDFYIHPFGKYCSASLIYTVPNNDMNKKEFLQISVIVSEGAINAVFTEDLLSGFRNQTEKIVDLFKAFYVKVEKYSDSIEKFNALRNLVFSFGKSFPEENVLQQGTKSGRVFIFGLELAGKTTVIKQLKNEDTTVVPPTINVDVTKALLEDLCLIIYDAPGQLNLQDLWKPYLKRDLDGLVFVLDVVHRMKYPAAKNVLFEIATNRDLMGLPLLILLNKKDLFQPNIDILIQTLELNKFQGRPVKWFLTSALNNEGVLEAFTWLAHEISKNK